MKPYLGRPLTQLIGRERDLFTLERRLAKGARLITLLGPGGSGKTRLAQALFEQLLSKGTGTVFVDLVGLQDPALVPANMAIELGVGETADLDAAAAVLAALVGRSVTVVLDNLEELTDSRDFLALLLRNIPGLQLVATSRIPLGISGEVEFVVQPLDLPYGDTLAEVEASPAGRLFLERARAISGLDEFDAETATAIARLCRRLDGLPLALELAAARTRIMPPSTILGHLDERTTGLLVKTNKSDRRHESLDAILGWSLDLLEADELTLLGAIAICPGGFDLELARAMAPGLDVLRAIDVLATHGLLTRRDGVNKVPWYRLLETIRGAAQARTTAHDTNKAWTLLASYLAEQVAGTREAFWRADEAVFLRLDALLDNIRAVITWTADNDPTLGLSIVGDFHWYWSSRGGSREGIADLSAFVASSQEPSRAMARALNGWALLEEDVSGPAVANRLATEASRIALLVGDGEQEVLALARKIVSSTAFNHASGSNAAHDGDAQRMGELLPSVDHPAVRWMCALALALIQASESGYSRAMMRRACNAEAALANSPYRGLHANAAGNLAILHLDADEPAEAHAAASRALLAIDHLSPELKAWAYMVHSVTSTRTRQVFQAVSSLRAACELIVSRRLAVRPELVLASLEVFAESNRPLIVAKLWGVLTGQESLVGADRLHAERLVSRCRSLSDPVAFELAVRLGGAVGLAQVAEEVLSLLETSSVSPASTSDWPRHGKLTPREVEVLTLVGTGMSDREVGAALFISPKTASVHVSNVKAKLGVDTRLEAALWARDAGLVADDGPA